MVWLDGVQLEAAVEVRPGVGAQPCRGGHHLPDSPRRLMGATCASSTRRSRPFTQVRTRRPGGSHRREEQAPRLVVEDDPCSASAGPPLSARPIGGDPAGDRLVVVFHRPASRPLTAPTELVAQQLPQVPRGGSTPPSRPRSPPPPAPRSTHRCPTRAPVSVVAVRSGMTRLAVPSG